MSDSSTGTAGSVVKVTTLAATATLFAPAMRQNAAMINARAFPILTMPWVYVDSRTTQTALARTTALRLLQNAQIAVASTNRTVVPVLPLGATALALVRKANEMRSIRARASTILAATRLVWQASVQDVTALQSAPTISPALRMAAMVSKAPVVMAFAPPATHTAVTARVPARRRSLHVLMKDVTDSRNSALAAVSS